MAALLFAVLSAMAAVMAPVVFSRVVVDDILMQAPASAAPAFGQATLTHGLARMLSIEPLIAAGALYLFWVLLWAVFSHLFAY